MPPPPQLAYDKGERRFKHVGRRPEAYIQFDDSSPKKWIGKCPNNIPDTVKAEILNKAIPAASADAEIAYVDRLYAVYQGVVYEAMSSDEGQTYHAYPYRGRLTKALVIQLKAMAIAEGSLMALKDWFADHIEYGGKL
jgi:hypothetical protein